MKIMNRSKARAEHFATFLEVAEVSQAVMLTGIAAAIRVQRAGVVAISGIADFDGTP